MVSSLHGRRVVLGVCGGIAAYKVAEVCRRLVDAGAVVTPVMTDDATRFLGPATLSALASEKVQTSLWSETDPIPHTALGRSADLVLVAPATARLLGRYAAGIADDLLTATLLATRAPVLLAPAMHTEMWEHPATRANVEVLTARGVVFVGPADGRLAGGDEGPGRLAEPDQIVAAAERAMSPPDLAGRSVLVTAGGTREPIDAVRFLANRSSGRQGHAVAAEAASRGAAVVLVTTTDPGPVPPSVEVVRVDTAAEMEAAVLARGPSADAVVMAAAVADFRPKAPASGKLPKSEGPPEIVLEPTVDVLAELGRRRRPGQVLVGFAAETAQGDELRARAAEKLAAKHLDLVVANDVSAPDAGFEHDTNRALLLEEGGSCKDVPLVPKRVLAALVLDIVARRLDATTEGEQR